MKSYSRDLVKLIFVLITTWTGTTALYADKPCAASQIANRSVICVCTAQYCDTVIRETPRDGVYFTYTSSERGLRFKKSHGMLQESCEGKGNYDVTLLLNASRTYQIIYGFGGAVTDAAGINYKNLRDPKLMQNFVESYCGSTGLQYSMLRVPIGGTDFSTRPYTYNDVPENDLTLTNFSLAYEDYEYKLPLLKACMKASDVSINVVASMWSPPIWMKTNNKISGLSRLKPEYFQTLADYHYKFLQSYKEEGIRIWGMTLTNEPVNVLWGENFLLNNLGWSLDYLSIWLENYLGPMIRNSTFKDIKIMTGDDQRYAIPLWWNTLISFFPGTYKYLDGVAVHFYSDKIVPASIMTSAMADSPEKFLLYTEACVIPSPSEQPVELGLWSRAEDYITNIMETLNYNSTGWIDWNMCLNPEGGPNWIDNTVDSPVIVFAEAGAFIKQPMFYAMGHFSKFIPQGSRRIHVDMSSEDVLNVAFLTPENSIVVVLYNEGEEKSVLIQLGDKQLVIEMGKKYITTVEFPYRMTSASLKRPLQAFHPKIIRIPN